MYQAQLLELLARERIKDLRAGAAASRAPAIDVDGDRRPGSVDPIDHRRRLALWPKAPRPHTPLVPDVECEPGSSC